MADTTIRLLDPLSHSPSPTDTRMVGPAALEEQPVLQRGEELQEVPSPGQVEGWPLDPILLTCTTVPLLSIAL